MEAEDGLVPLTRQELTSRFDRIRDTLCSVFHPVVLELKDDSARHAGHSGASPEGETHFILTIEADAFAGMSRVQMHRAVNGALKEEFDAGLHALMIKARAPSQTGDAG